MGIVDRILKKLQAKRMEMSRFAEGPGQFNTKGTYGTYASGFVDGLSYAEQIIFDEQQRTDQMSKGLWYTGSPNDIKPNNRGTYILIMKAHFDSEDGVKKDHIYIDTDFWDGEKWEGFEIGDGSWEVLYFTKLKWLKFRLPDSLGMTKTDDLFIT